MTTDPAHRGPGELLFSLIVLVFSVAAFWQADEFANFEIANSIQKNSNRDFHKQDFVREGLKMGLAFDQALGTNPFQLGFIGGTDNHNGLPGDVDEADFIGGHGPEDGTVDRRRTGGVGGWIDGVDLSIGSLAGVGAEENTRASIWDAMKRRETFATSGPRMRVRMFAGADLLAESDPVAMVETGYEKGVPMGGNLSALSSAPRITVYAEKDPDGANLDRIQVIKGWVDAAGETQEQVYDVACSDGLTVDTPSHRCPDNCARVNLSDCSITPARGATELNTVWRDPDFEAGQAAFYYVRVLENPSCRWSTLQCQAAGINPFSADCAAQAAEQNARLDDEGVIGDVYSKCCLDPANEPFYSPVLQERAWTSPIWLNPTL